MASAYLQKKSPFWWLKFRSFTGKPKAVSSGLRSEEYSREVALEMAQGLEQDCRTLEHWRQASNLAIVAAARRLLEARVLTPEEAHAWETGGPAAAPALLAPRHDPTGLSVLDAALAHPSVKREREIRPREFRRHLAELREFVALQKSDKLRDLERRHITAYIEHMRSRRLAWDSRRHRLLYLRYACQMAPDYGLQDVIGRYRLDPRQREDRPQQIDTLEPAEICRAVRELLTIEDGRWLAAFGLMTFVGLRPSEALRLRMCDYLPSERVVRVGAVEAKTAGSQRDLPIPSIVAEWVERIHEPAHPKRYLIHALHSAPGAKTAANPDQCYDTVSFNRYVAAQVSKACGRRVPVKVLRKTFASLALWAWDIDPRWIDAYLGRNVFGLTGTTNQHYIARAQRKALAPVAKEIDARVRSMLAIEDADR